MTLERELLQLEEFYYSTSKNSLMHISTCFHLFNCKKNSQLFLCHFNFQSLQLFSSSLCNKMDLNVILAEAERLLLNYCRQSVVKSFKELCL